MITLLPPLKSVIPVVFTPNPGPFSWKLPPSAPFESTNKAAERSELFFFDWNGIKDPGRFWWVGPKLRNGLKGGCLDGSGSFKSSRSDSWHSDVTTNTDKTSSNPVFS